MPYKDVFVEWYDEAGNSRSLVFWHKNPTLNNEEGYMDDLIAATNRACKIIEQHHQANPRFLRYEVSWFVRENCIGFSYNYIERHELNKKLFSVFKPEIHPKRVKERIDVYRNSLT